MNSIKKNPQVHLRDFFDLWDSQSDALLDVVQQVTKHQIIFIILVFFIYKILFCNNVHFGMREGEAKVAPCYFGVFLQGLAG
jgi:hypothetical protein